MQSRHTSAVHKAGRSVFTGRSESHRRPDCGINTWILQPREDLPPRIYTNLPDCETNRGLTLTIYNLKHLIRTCLWKRRAPLGETQLRAISKATLLPLSRRECNYTQPDRVTTKAKILPAPRPQLHFQLDALVKRR